MLIPQWVNCVCQKSSGSLTTLMITKYWIRSQNLLNADIKQVLIKTLVLCVFVFLYNYSKLYKWKFCLFFDKNDIICLKLRMNETQNCLNIWNLVDSWKLV